QRPNRRSHLTLGVAAPLERRLSQNDSHRGAQHRATDRAGPKSGRCGPASCKSASCEMKCNSRTRCAIVCLGFVLLFSAFSFRLIYLQMIKHEQYAGLAAEKHVIKQPIFAERGTILDANNEVLAHNVPVETVVADATRLTEANATVDLISAELKLPRADVSEKLHSDRRYIVLKREVPKAITDSLRQKL